MKKVDDFVGAEDDLKLVGVIPEGNIFKAYSAGIAKSGRKNTATARPALREKRPPRRRSQSARQRW